MDDVFFTELRHQMIDEIAENVTTTSARIGKVTLDGRVMEVMGQIPRHEFVPLELNSYAYANQPLPIGCGKTISQPFINALMTDLLEIEPEDTILEIGTGYGYQAAILAALAKKVYTVEAIEELAEEALERFGRLDYGNIKTRVADGYNGWPDHAPYDKIMVTAAPDLIPPPLLNQLKPGGRMVVPAGTADAQQLMLVVKDTTGRMDIQEILPVRFSLLESDEIY